MKWRRYRFQEETDDPRPVHFPPPGPYWVTGYGGDDSEWATIVAYLPPEEELTRYWPGATGVEYTEEDTITYTTRFPRPDWYKEGASP